jgi:hypothetical protein
MKKWVICCILTFGIQVSLCTGEEYDSAYLASRRDPDADWPQTRQTAGLIVKAGVDAPLEAQFRFRQAELILERLRPGCSSLRSELKDP